MIIRIRLIALTLLILLAPPLTVSQAQGWGSINISIPMANTGYMLGSQIVTSTIRYPSDAGDHDVEDQAASAPDGGFIIRRVPVAKSAAPDLFAANYPTAERQKARQLFAQLLAGYDPLMEELQVDSDDYAAAAAVFVAGSYTAFHERDFDDAAFAPLVRDLRVRLSQTGTFEDASLADKQSAFDQYVIIGIMAAMTHAGLQQMGPGQERDLMSQKLREAGKRYLEQTFGVPAGQIIIDTDGLRY